MPNPPTKRSSRATASKHAVLLLAFLCVAAQYECSIDAPVPLGTPDPKTFDPKLLGKWTCVEDSKPDEGGAAEVYAWSDREYYILTGSGEPGDDLEHMRAFAAELDGKRFLNLQLLSFEMPDVYNLIGYTFEGADALRFRIADFGSKETKPRTPEALEAYVRQHLAAGTLYDDQRYSCTRKTTAVSPAATMARPNTKPHQMPAASAPTPNASQTPTGRPITQ